MFKMGDERAMKTKELIKLIKKLDPTGELDVEIFEYENGTRKFNPEWNLEIHHYDKEYGCHEDEPDSVLRFIACQVKT